MNDLRATLKLGNEIDKGHFGCVHVGQDGVRDLLAVKVLHASPGEPPERWMVRKADLLKEAANLEKAKHRHIVQVYYVCEAANDDAIYMAMEYCHRGSLQRPYKQGPLPPRQVLKIAREVASGLAVLHDRGLIHRDIKPGNILLDQNGTTKIGDFGLVTDDVVEGYAAGAGYVDHLAPEYYTDRVCSVRTDLWALGVTLYRLLHGHEWYQSGPAPRHVVQSGGFADSLKWLPHIDKKWRRIIRHLLRDDPKDRPADARALARLLAEVEPADWTCEIHGNEIVWRRPAGRRVIEVRQIKTGARKYSWHAESRPVGNGRTRTLGRNHDLDQSQLERELRQFFNH